MKNSFLFGESCPLTKPSQTFPTKIDDNLALGLDLGIGSCGQALISTNTEDKPIFKHLSVFPDQIVFLGVRAFDIPEMHEKKGIKLKNPQRRDKRLLRRTTRRRAWRMWEVRRLFKQQGLLPDDYPVDENLWKHPAQRGENPPFDKWRDWHSQMTAGENGQDGPWEWRVKGLDEELDSLAWAATLIHLAKHRGFKSNRKSGAGDDDGGKVIAALKENKNRMEEKGYRTIGEMLLKDEAFSKNKRNKSGSYTAVIYRADQELEIKQLFSKQRSLGNQHADDKLEEAYLKLFNAQYPLQNPIKLLGDCPFEKGEKRASRYAYSFELSRALQKLNTLTLELPDGQDTPLSKHVEADQGGYALFIEQFASHGTKTNPGRITWLDLRRILNLNADIHFVDLPSPKSKKGDAVQSTDDLEKEDFVTRSNANGAAKGSYILNQVIGDELWNQCSLNNPSQLDHAAFALTFFEEIENDYKTEESWGVVNQMQSDKVDQQLIDLIKENLYSDKPTLHKFSDTASMSLLASRKLIPLLSKGMVYSKACTKLYGDHRQHDFNFDEITNPVVKSVVRECLKQVVHLIDETGKIPGRICVELSRDLGKSIIERNEIKRELDKRTGRKNANRENLKDHLNRDPDRDELLRYELWLEQKDTCPYCGDTLGRPDEIIHREFEIDHILPRSRSHDNSYDNKVLVHTRCNQNKQNATPFEFSQIGNGDDQSEGWLRYTTIIRALTKIRKHKRRNLLNTTFAEDESKFASRHLNDSRYIARLVTHYLHEIYAFSGEKRLEEKGSKRRVFVQPGPLTAIVRKAWGLENLKKDRDGKRLGDKHHAIDALICALLSEGQRQYITRREQNKRAARKAFSSFAKSYELMERENDHNRIPRKVPPPWKNFRDDVVQALDLFTVSRRENRKGRGCLHLDTLYSVQKDGDGKETVYSRKPIITQIDGKAKASLTLAQIEKIRGIDDKRNHWLREALTKWIDRGSPVGKELQPSDPQGNIIKRVYLAQKIKSGRHYPQGYVTSGNQVRVDVFSQTKKNGEKTYFLIPIYSHHLAQKDIPNRAIAANKPEEDWTIIDETYQFEFSLWSNSRFEVVKKNGEKVHGSYCSVHRGKARIEYANPEDNAENPSPPNNGIKTPGVAVKTGVLEFKKFNIDRLGRKSIIELEKRTWRGTTVT